MNISSPSQTQPCPNLNSWVSLPREAPPESFPISINGNSNFLAAQAAHHEASLRLFRNLMRNPSRNSVCPTFKTQAELQHSLPPPLRELPSSLSAMLQGPLLRSAGCHAFPRSSVPSGALFPAQQQLIQWTCVRGCHCSVHTHCPQSKIPSP